MRGSWNWLCCWCFSGSFFWKSSEASLSVGTLVCIQFFLPSPSVGPLTPLLDVMISALFLLSIPVLPFVNLVPISLQCSSSCCVPFSHWSFCRKLEQCGMEWRMVCTRRCRRLGKKTSLAKWLRCGLWFWLLHSVSV